MHLSIRFTMVGIPQIFLSGVLSHTEQVFFHVSKWMMYTSYIIGDVKVWVVAG